MGASFPPFLYKKTLTSKMWGGCRGEDQLFYLTLVELRSTNACLKKDMFFLNHPSLSNMDYSHNPGYDREGRAKKIKIKLGGGGGMERPLKGLCLPPPPSDAGE
nr:hypothetical protein [Morchella crassipes]